MALGSQRLGTSWRVNGNYIEKRPIELSIGRFFVPVTLFLVSL